jgi:hypothetical protein
LDGDYEEIIIERVSSGLGFIISGGPDKQHICEDQAIILTKIITAVRLLSPNE